MTGEHRCIMPGRAERVGERLGVIADATNLRWRVLGKDGDVQRGRFIAGSASWRGMLPTQGFLASIGGPVVSD